MLSAPLESALQHIEKQFKDLSAALVSGEPVALESASAAMRQAGIDFSALIQRLTPAERKNRQLTIRLEALADGLGERRASLLRRTALVERELHTILPATQGGTYANAAGAYGNPAKSSGAFKRFSA
ncbi:MAG: hypothetical protein Q8K22_05110 [Rhodoferax sp.]|nr:hypothetical protein [Rhodoferax sp.]